MIKFLIAGLERSSLLYYVSDQTGYLDQQTDQLWKSEKILFQYSSTTKDLDLVFIRDTSEFA